MRKSYNVSKDQTGTIVLVAGGDDYKDYHDHPVVKNVPKRDVFEDYNIKGSTYKWPRRSLQHDNDLLTTSISTPTSTTGHAFKWPKRSVTVNKYDGLFEDDSEAELSGSEVTTGIWQSFNWPGQMNEHEEEESTEESEGTTGIWQGFHWPESLTESGKRISGIWQDFKWPKAHVEHGDKFASTSSGMPEIGDKIDSNSERTTAAWQGFSFNWPKAYSEHDNEFTSTDFDLHESHVGMESNSEQSTGIWQGFNWPEAHSEHENEFTSADKWYDFSLPGSSVGFESNSAEETTGIWQAFSWPEYHFNTVASNVGVESISEEVTLQDLSWLGRRPETEANNIGIELNSEKITLQDFSWSERHPVSEASTVASNAEIESNSEEITFQDLRRTENLNNEAVISNSKESTDAWDSNGTFGAETHGNKTKSFLARILEHHDKSNDVETNTKPYLYHNWKIFTEEEISSLGHNENGNGAEKNDNSAKTIPSVDYHQSEDHTENELITESYVKDTKVASAVASDIKLTTGSDEDSSRRAFLANLSKSKDKLSSPEEPTPTTPEAFIDHSEANHPTNFGEKESSYTKNGNKDQVNGSFVSTTGIQGTQWSTMVHTETGGESTSNLITGGEASHGQQEEAKSSGIQTVSGNTEASTSNLSGSPGGFQTSQDHTETKPYVTTVSERTTYGVWQHLLDETTIKQILSKTTGENNQQHNESKINSSLEQVTSNVDEASAENRKSLPLHTHGENQTQNIQPITELSSNSVSHSGEIVMDKYSKIDTTHVVSHLDNFSEIGIPTGAGENVVTTGSQSFLGELESPGVTEKQNIEMPKISIDNREELSTENVLLGEGFGGLESTAQYESVASRYDSNLLNGNEDNSNDENFKQSLSSLLTEVDEIMENLHKSESQVDENEDTLHADGSEHDINMIDDLSQNTNNKQNINHGLTNLHVSDDYSDALGDNRDIDEEEGFFTTNNLEDDLISVLAEVTSDMQELTNFEEQVTLGRKDYLQKAENEESTNNNEVSNNDDDNSDILSTTLSYEEEHLNSMVVSMDDMMQELYSIEEQTTTEESTDMSYDSGGGVDNKNEDKENNSLTDASEEQSTENVILSELEEILQELKRIEEANTKPEEVVVTTSDYVHTVQMNTLSNIFSVPGDNGGSHLSETVLDSGLNVEHTTSAFLSKVDDIAQKLSGDQQKINTMSGFLSHSVGKGHDEETAIDSGTSFVETPTIKPGVDEELNVIPSVLNSMENTHQEGRTFQEAETDVERHTENPGGENNEHHTGSDVEHHSEIEKGGGNYHIESHSDKSEHHTESGGAETEEHQMKSSNHANTTDDFLSDIDVIAQKLSSAIEKEINTEPSLLHDNIENGNGNDIYNESGGKNHTVNGGTTEEYNTNIKGTETSKHYTESDVVESGVRTASVEGKHHTESTSAVVEAEDQRESEGVEVKGSRTESTHGDSKGFEVVGKQSSEVEHHTESAQEKLHHTENERTEGEYRTDIEGSVANQNNHTESEYVETEEPHTASADIERVHQSEQKSSKLQAEHHAEGGVVDEVHSTKSAENEGEHHSENKQGEGDLSTESQGDKADQEHNVGNTSAESKLHRTESGVEAGVEHDTGKTGGIVEGEYHTESEGTEAGEHLVENSMHHEGTTDDFLSDIDVIAQKLSSVIEKEINTEPSLLHDISENSNENDIYNEPGGKHHTIYGETTEERDTESEIVESSVRTASVEGKHHTESASAVVEGEDRRESEDAEVKGSRTESTHGESKGFEVVGKHASEVEHHTESAQGKSHHTENEGIEGEYQTSIEGSETNEDNHTESEYVGKVEPHTTSAYIESVYPSELTSSKFEAEHPAENGNVDEEHNTESEEDEGEHHSENEKGEGNHTESGVEAGVEHDTGDAEGIVEEENHTESEGTEDGENQVKSSMDHEATTNGFLSEIADIAQKLSSVDEEINTVSVLHDITESSNENDNYNESGRKYQTVYGDTAEEYDTDGEVVESGVRTAGQHHTESASAVVEGEDQTESEGSEVKGSRTSEVEHHTESAQDKLHHTENERTEGEYHTDVEGSETNEDNHTESEYVETEEPYTASADIESVSQSERTSSKFEAEHHTENGDVAEEHNTESKEDEGEHHSENENGNGDFHTESQSDKAEQEHDIENTLAETTVHHTESGVEAGVEHDTGDVEGIIEEENHTESEVTEAEEQVKSSVHHEDNKNDNLSTTNGFLSEIADVAQKLSSVDQEINTVSVLHDITENSNENDIYNESGRKYQTVYGDTAEEYDTGGEVVESGVRTAGQHHTESASAVVEGEDQTESEGSEVKGSRTSEVEHHTESAQDKLHHTENERTEGEYHTDVEGSETNEDNHTESEYVETEEPYTASADIESVSQSERTSSKFEAEHHTENGDVAEEHNTESKEDEGEHHSENENGNGDFHTESQSDKAEQEHDIENTLAETTVHHTESGVEAGVEHDTGDVEGIIEEENHTESEVTEAEEQVKSSVHHEDNKNDNLSTTNGFLSEIADVAQKLSSVDQEINTVSVLHDITENSNENDIYNESGRKYQTVYGDTAEEYDTDGEVVESGVRTAGQHHTESASAVVEGEDLTESEGNEVKGSRTSEVEHHTESSEDKLHHTENERTEGEYHTEVEGSEGIEDNHTESEYVETEEPYTATVDIESVRQSERTSSKFEAEHHTENGDVDEEHNTESKEDEVEHHSENENGNGDFHTESQSDKAEQEHDIENTLAETTVHHTESGVEAGVEHDTGDVEGIVEEENHTESEVTEAEEQVRSSVHHEDNKNDNLSTTNGFLSEIADVAQKLSSVDQEMNTVSVLHDITENSNENDIRNEPGGKYHTVYGDTTGEHDTESKFVESGIRTASVEGKLPTESASAVVEGEDQTESEGAEVKGSHTEFTHGENEEKHASEVERHTESAKGKPQHTENEGTEGEYRTNIEGSEANEDNHTESEYVETEEPHTASADIESVHQSEQKSSKLKTEHHAEGGVVDEEHNTKSAENEGERHSENEQGEGDFHTESESVKADQEHEIDNSSAETKLHHTESGVEAGVEHDTGSAGGIVEGEYHTESEGTEAEEHQVENSMHHEGTTNGFLSEIDDIAQKLSSVDEEINTVSVLHDITENSNENGTYNEPEGTWRNLEQYTKSRGNLKIKGTTVSKSEFPSGKGSNRNDDKLTESDQKSSTNLYPKSMKKLKKRSTYPQLKKTEPQTEQINVSQEGNENEFVDFPNHKASTLCHLCEEAEEEQAEPIEEDAVLPSFPSNHETSTVCQLCEEAEEESPGKASSKKPHGKVTKFQEGLTKEPGHERHNTKKLSTHRFVDVTSNTEPLHHKKTTKTSKSTKKNEETITLASRHPSSDYKKEFEEEQRSELNFLATLTEQQRSTKATTVALNSKHVTKSQHTSAQERANDKVNEHYTRHGKTKLNAKTTEMPQHRFEGESEGDEKDEQPNNEDEEKENGEQHKETQIEHEGIINQEEEEHNTENVNTEAREPHTKSKGGENIEELKEQGPESSASEAQTQNGTEENETEHYEGQIEHEEATHHLEEQNEENTESGSAKVEEHKKNKGMEQHKETQIEHEGVINQEEEEHNTENVNTEAREPHMKSKGGENIEELNEQGPESSASEAQTPNGTEENETEHYEGQIEHEEATHHLEEQNEKNTESGTAKVEKHKKNKGMEHVKHEEQITRHGEEQTEHSTESEIYENEELHTKSQEAEGHHTESEDEQEGITTHHKEEEEQREYSTGSNDDQNKTGKKEKSKNGKSHHEDHEHGNHLTSLEEKQKQPATESEISQVEHYTKHSAAKGKKQGKEIEGIEHEENKINEHHEKDNVEHEQTTHLETENKDLTGSFGTEAEGHKTEGFAENIEHHEDQIEHEGVKNHHEEGQREHSTESNEEQNVTEEQEKENKIGEHLKEGHMEHEEQVSRHEEYYSTESWTNKAEHDNTDNEGDEAESELRNGSAKAEEQSTESRSAATKKNKEKENEDKKAEYHKAQNEHKKIETHNEKKQKEHYTEGEATEAAEEHTENEGAKTKEQNGNEEESNSHVNREEELQGHITERNKEQSTQTKENIIGEYHQQDHEHEEQVTGKQEQNTTSEAESNTGNGGVEEHTNSKGNERIGTKVVESYKNGADKEQKTGHEEEQKEHNTENVHTEGEYTGSIGAETGEQQNTKSGGGVTKEHNEKEGITNYHEKEEHEGQRKHTTGINEKESTTEIHHTEVLESETEEHQMKSSKHEHSTNDFVSEVDDIIQKLNSLIVAQAISTVPSILHDENGINNEHEGTYQTGYEGTEREHNIEPTEANEHYTKNKSVEPGERTASAGSEHHTESASVKVEEEYHTENEGSEVERSHARTGGNENEEHHTESGVAEGNLHTEIKGVEAKEKHLTASESEHHTESVQGKHHNTENEGAEEENHTIIAGTEANKKNHTESEYVETVKTQTASVDIESVHHTERISSNFQVESESVEAGEHHTKKGEGNYHTESQTVEAEQKQYTKNTRFGTERHHTESGVETEAEDYTQSIGEEGEGELHTESGDDETEKHHMKGSNQKVSTNDFLSEFANIAQKLSSVINNEINTESSLLHDTFEPFEEKHTAYEDTASEYYTNIEGTGAEEEHYTDSEAIKPSVENKEHLTESSVTEFEGKSHSKIEEVEEKHLTVSEGEHQTDSGQGEHHTDIKGTEVNEEHHTESEIFTVEEHHTAKAEGEGEHHTESGGAEGEQHKMKNSNHEDSTIDFLSEIAVIAQKLSSIIDTMNTESGLLHDTNSNKNDVDNEQEGTYQTENKGTDREHNAHTEAAKPSQHYTEIEAVQSEERIASVEGEHHTESATAVAEGEHHTENAGVEAEGSRAENEGDEYKVHLTESSVVETEGRPYSKIEEVEAEAKHLTSSDEHQTESVQGEHRLTENGGAEGEHQTNIEGTKVNERHHTETSWAETKPDHTESGVEAGAEHYTEKTGGVVEGEHNTESGGVEGENHQMENSNHEDTTNYFLLEMAAIEQELSSVIEKEINTVLSVFDTFENSNETDINNEAERLKAETKQTEYGDTTGQHITNIEATKATQHYTENEGVDHSVSANTIAEGDHHVENEESESKEPLTSSEGEHHTESALGEHRNNTNGGTERDNQTNNEAAEGNEEHHTESEYAVTKPHTESADIERVHHTESASSMVEAEHHAESGGIEGQHQTESAGGEVEHRSENGKEGSYYMGTQGVEAKQEHFTKNTWAETNLHHSVSGVEAGVEHYTESGGAEVEEYQKASSILGNTTNDFLSEIDEIAQRLSSVINKEINTVPWVSLEENTEYGGSTAEEYNANSEDQHHIERTSAIAEEEHQTEHGGGYHTNKESTEASEEQHTKSGEVETEAHNTGTEVAQRTEITGGSQAEEHHRKTEDGEAEEHTESEGAETNEHKEEKNKHGEEHSKIPELYSISESGSSEPSVLSSTENMSVSQWLSVEQAQNETPGVEFEGTNTPVVEFELSLAPEELQENTGFEMRTPEVNEKSTRGRTTNKVNFTSAFKFSTTMLLLMSSVYGHGSTAAASTTRKPRPSVYVDLPVFIPNTTESSTTCTETTKRPSDNEQCIVVYVNGPASLNGTKWNGHLENYDINAEIESYSQNINNHGREAHGREAQTTTPTHNTEGGSSTPSVDHQTESDNEKLDLPKFLLFNKCDKTDFTEKKDCVCAVDDLVSSIKHKEFGEGADAKLECSRFLKLPNGIIIGSDSLAQIRKKRSFLFGKTCVPFKREAIDYSKGFFDEIFKIVNTEFDIYALPGTEVIIPCLNKNEVIEFNKYMQYSWLFDDSVHIPDSHIKQDEGNLLIERVSANDSGNYTCTVKSKISDEHSNPEQNYHHQLVVVSTPIYKIKTRIIYTLNQSCTLTDGDVINTYLPNIFTGMLCGFREKLCTVEILRPNCIPGPSEHLLNVTFVVTMRTLSNIIPTVDNTKCKINCQMHLYAKLAGVLVSNIEIIEKQPITSELNTKTLKLYPKKVEPHIKGKKGYWSAPPMLIITCPAGYGVEKAHPRVCVVCPKNTYSGGEESYCKMCQAGKYQPTPGSKSCLRCSSPLENAACLRALYSSTGNFKLYVALAFGFLILTIIGLFYLGYKKPTEENAPVSKGANYVFRHGLRKTVNEEEGEPLLGDESNAPPPQVPPPDF